MGSQATGSTRMIEFAAWVEVNKNKLLIGAAIVAAAIGAYAFYKWHRDETEAEANAALLKVDKPGVRSELAPEPGAQAFLQVATAHPGTSAAGRALLFAAGASFREYKYEDAKTQFEQFLRDYAESPLAPTAALGVAASLDAMNKTNEALLAYQDVGNRFGGAAVAAPAKLGLARLYAAADGSAAQALKICEELMRPNARSVWSAEAASLRKQLLSRYPELARANAPPAAILSAASNAPGTNLPTVTATNAAPDRPAARPN